VSGAPVLEDRDGVSWQVVPAGMEEVLADPDPARGQRAMQAMLGMGKLELAALRAAADGVPVSSRTHPPGRPGAAGRRPSCHEPRRTPTTRLTQGRAPGRTPGA
jgi:hypothetical protein